MTDLELIRKAINFAMYELCDGYLDMPSGCDGCPLNGIGNIDENGDVDCRGEMFRQFVKKYELDSASTAAKEN